MHIIHHALSGAVTFNLTDASYSEAATMTINANADASAANTLTIKPTLANTTIGILGEPLLQYLNSAGRLDHHRWFHFINQQQRLSVNKQQPAVTSPLVTAGTQFNSAVIRLASNGAQERRHQQHH